MRTVIEAAVAVLARLQRFISLGSCRVKFGVLFESRRNVDPLEGRLYRFLAKHFEECLAKGDNVASPESLTTSNARIRSMGD
ncbi:hypothetical protein [Bradyrhizobium symbiodeficiens]|uniref:hypothetical protein n=1 Tax=Bradyrhizobium symbiodeficiens TaxID=1404367 RepID=UPI00140FE39D|nr:hypothetical protein [Bradyrhizobium symbiodeficiens]QIO98853.1 hypothetical protein HAU86_03105 [Bradyrhizobium symbiodeficiens]